MQIAYELKLTMAEAYTLIDRDEMGWWIAYFTHKNELQEKETARRQRRRKRPREAPIYSE